MATLYSLPTEVLLAICVEAASEDPFLLPWDRRSRLLCDCPEVFVRRVGFSRRRMTDDPDLEMLEKFFGSCEHDGTARVAIREILESRTAVHPGSYVVCALHNAGRTRFLSLLRDAMIALDRELPRPEEIWSGTIELPPMVDEHERRFLAFCLEAADVGCKKFALMECLRAHCARCDVRGATELYEEYKSVFDAELPRPLADIYLGRRVFVGVLSGSVEFLRRLVPGLDTLASDDWFYANATVQASWAFRVSDVYSGKDSFSSSEMLEYVLEETNVFWCQRYFHFWDDPERAAEGMEPEMLDHESVALELFGYLLFRASDAKFERVARIVRRHLVFLPWVWNGTFADAVAAYWSGARGSHRRKCRTWRHRCRALGMDLRSFWKLARALRTCERDLEENGSRPTRGVT